MSWGDFYLIRMRLTRLQDRINRLVEELEKATSRLDQIDSRLDQIEKDDDEPETLGPSWHVPDSGWKVMTAVPLDLADRLRRIEEALHITPSD